ncbi:MAG: alpha/beta hydrolase [Planctomycetota bacterium]|jgi:acetyl esterase/lipase
MKLTTIIAAAIATCLIALPAFAQNKKAELPAPLKGADYEIYKTASGSKLGINIFYPKGHKASDQRPAIVFFFGGGWNGGNPSQFEGHCKYLAARGMVAMAADYRVKSRQDTPPSACVEDGKSAIRWVRTNARRLGVDPDRIAAGGGSAGGHVAAATATAVGFQAKKEDKSISAKPNALVLFNPVYDNGPNGYGHDRVQDYWQRISPLHNIYKNTPPAIVFLGTEDPLIPVATAKDYQARMASVGAASELHLYEGQPHGFFNLGKGGPLIFKDTILKMDRFLASQGYLQGKPKLSLLELK